MIPESIAANPPAAVAREASQSAGSLGQEDFLRMLIAQLENQDPLNPQDATEFTAQLAQFSSLEQMIAIREGVEALQTPQDAASSGLDGVPLVGRNVLYESDAFQVAGDGSLPSLFVELSAPGQIQQIDVFDTAGRLVRSLGVPGQLDAGLNEIDLSGMDPLPSGTYRIHADRGEAGSATTLFLDRVTGSSVGEADPTLYFGEATTSLSRVREVRP